MINSLTKKEISMTLSTLNPFGSMIHPKTVYFCIDLEASGPVPGLYNMVSIGGVVVRYKDNQHQLGDEFYYEIKPDFKGFKDEAMAIHGLSKEHLENYGESSRVVLEKITDFVRSELQPGERPLFVGHNAPFDWMFVAWYYASAGLDNPFGYNALDTKALMMGRMCVPWNRSNKDTLSEFFPTLVQPENAHNALADARFQAEILIHLLDWDGQLPT